MPAAPESPLHVAVRLNHHEEVSALLLARADPEETEPAFGWTALHVAAGNGSAKALEVLLDAGASTDAKSSLDGECPLHLAAAEGHTQILRLLGARAAAAPNVRNNDGETPLHVAVQHVGGKPGLGHISCLLELGADPHLKDNEGHDAFATAGVYTNRAEEVCIVLRGGGRPIEREPDDPWPDTPGELPEGRDPVEVAEAIREAGNGRFRRGLAEEALKLYLKSKHYLPATSSDPKAIADESQAQASAARRARACQVAVAGNAAACELKLGRYDACVRRCDGLLLLDPSNVKALYRKALALRGLVAEGEEVEEDPEEVLRQAAAIDPSDATIQKELADIETRRRKDKADERLLAKKMFG